MSAEGTHTASLHEPSKPLAQPTERRWCGGEAGRRNAEGGWAVARLVDGGATGAALHEGAARAVVAGLGHP